MHTFKRTENAKSIFHYNSDISEVRCVVSKENILDENAHTVTVLLEGEDLMAFIAEVVRNTKIAELQDADFEEILLGK